MERLGPERVFIGVGANRANRVENIVLALLMLGADPKVRLRKCSAPFLTEPVSDSAQPTFVNAVVELETTHDPASLLAKAKAIESALGRAGASGAPRPIDLDILLFGDRVVDEPGLEVPHPRMLSRHFVLFPLAEIAPEAIHPIAGLPVAELKRRLPPTEFLPKRVEWGRVPRWSTVSTATS